MFHVVIKHLNKEIDIKGTQRCLRILAGSKVRLALIQADVVEELEIRTKIQELDQRLGRIGVAAIAGDQDEPSAAAVRPWHPGFEEGGRWQNAWVEAAPATKSTSPVGRGQKLCINWSPWR